MKKINCVLFFIILLAVSVNSYANNKGMNEEQQKLNVKESFLKEIKKLPSFARDINNNKLVPIKNGEPDTSKMLFIYHYKYDESLLKTCQEINLEKLFVFNPD